MKKYYVAGFLFSEDTSQLVLIRKNKPESQKGLLNGVGGKIELSDESPLHAMIREFKEEAGVEIKTWKEFCKLQSDNFEVYFFKAFGDVTQVKTMEEEQIEVVNVSNLYNEDVLCNLDWLIPMALDKDNIHGIIDYLNL